MCPVAQCVNFTHTVRGTLSSCSPTDHQELRRPIYFERVCECYISPGVFVLQNRKLQDDHSDKAIHVLSCATSTVL
jgi:hypothetical protein